MKISGFARDFGKLSSSQLDKLGETPIEQIPTYYYDFDRFCLPLAADDVESRFGKNISLFDESSVTDGSRQGNYETGGGVNEPFVAMGAGIVAMGEGEAFSIAGAHVSAETFGQPGTTQGIVTDAVTANDCYCGAVTITTIDAPSALATFWWGAPTWRFIEKFFQAYRLEIKIQRRFQIVDESLFDLGMTPVPPEFIGASDSRIQPAPFIRATNDLMRTKGINSLFLTPNVRIAENVAGETESSIVPPPLVPVTYGHPRIGGLAQQMHCFGQPILFVPGMRFDIDFVNIQQASVYEALTSSITVSCQTPLEGLTGTITGEVGFGNNAATHCVVPGGCVSLGAVFKGYGLQPSACLQYMADYLTQGSMFAQMYNEVATVSGLLDGAYSQDSGLIGRVREVLGL